MIGRFRVPARHARLVVRGATLFVIALLIGALVVATRQPAPASPAAGKPLALNADVATGTAAYVPPIKHVFVINIENEDEDNTWGDTSAAPYLAKTLRQQGVLLNNYYGTAHNSQPNYIAQVSGQGPNLDMQLDCQVYKNHDENIIGPTTTGPGGQLIGSGGCIFPRGIPTIASQLDGAGLAWRGYMDGMARPCQHPVVGTVDDTQKATATSEYATRHDPFMYFHDIIDDQAYCDQHVVPLTDLTADLGAVATTPNLSYITPDLCDDGHDSPCANGEPGGLTSVDAFMRTWVPRILASPAYQQDGMLVITSDESDGPQSDSSACCGEGSSTNAVLPGIVGPGGGRIGALVLSRFTAPGTWSTTPYNHYALLASLEEIFGLPKLGYASVPNLDRFGLDVYNSGWDGSGGGITGAPSPSVDPSVDPSTSGSAGPGGSGSGSPSASTSTATSTAPSGSAGASTSASGAPSDSTSASAGASAGAAAQTSTTGKLVPTLQARARHTHRPRHARLSVRVTLPSGAATGRVLVTYRGLRVGRARLVDGAVTLTTGRLPLGARRLVVHYTGGATAYPAMTVVRVRVH